MSIQFWKSLLLIFVWSLWAGATPAQQRPLSLSDIETLLKNGVSQERIVKLLEERGVNFDAGVEARVKLRKAGARNNLMDAVEKASLEFIGRSREAQKIAEAKRMEEKRKIAEETRKREEESAKRSEAETKRKQEEEKLREEEIRQLEEARRKAEEEKKRIAEEGRKQEEEAAKRAQIERQKQQENEKHKKEEERRRVQEALKTGRAETPKYKNGELWQFNVAEKSNTGLALNGVYEVRYLEGGFEVFKVVGFDKSPVDNSKGQVGVLYAMLGRGRYFGGQYLKFPLVIGGKWGFQHISGGGGGGTARRVNISWNAEVTVRSVETVATQAGNFSTLKIAREERNSRGGSATFTYYYSPEAKSVIKMFFETPNLTGNLELVTLGVDQ